MRRILVVVLLAALFGPLSLGIQPVSSQTGETHTIVVSATATDWLDTGIALQPGDTVHITSDPTDVWCWGECTNANGTPDRPNDEERPETLFPDGHFGQIYARVGGEAFPGSTDFTVAASSAGNLELIMNERIGFHGDNSGTITFMAIVETGSDPSQEQFRWPWAPGSSEWKYIQGPHQGYGLDFQPNDTAGCADDGVGAAWDDWVYPAAKGTIIDAKRPVATDNFGNAADIESPVSLVIQHEGGYTSYYTHLANSPIEIEWDTKGTPNDFGDDEPVVITPSKVEMNDPLGNPSCFYEQGGNSEGAHIHVSLMKDGNPQVMLNTSFCGWKLVEEDDFLYLDEVERTVHPLHRDGGAPQYPWFEMGHQVVGNSEIGRINNDTCPVPDSPTRQVDRTEHMETGDRSIGSFFIDLLSAGLQQILRFYIGPFGSDVDLVLLRPDGSQVLPTDPGVQFVKTETSVVVTIDDAPPGEWSYTVIANELEPGGEDIRVTVDQFNGADLPANQAPDVDAGPDATILAGTAFSRSGFFVDPDLDAWTATVDYGSGAGEQPLALRPDKTFDLRYTYPAKGDYSVTVSVCDTVGCSQDTVVVTVRDVPDLTLCGNYWTGALSVASRTGSCPSNAIALEFPTLYPVMLCINSYTGQLTWSPRQTCSSSSRPHLMPDDGSLAYCESLWTGRLRAAGPSQCKDNERVGVIPA